MVCGPGVGDPYSTAYERILSAKINLLAGVEVGVVTREHGDEKGPS